MVSFVGPIVVGLPSTHMSIGAAYKVVSVTWLIAILGLVLAREVGTGTTVEALLSNYPANGLVAKEIPTEESSSLFQGV